MRRHRRAQHPLDGGERVCPRRALALREAFAEREAVLFAEELLPEDLPFALDLVFLFLLPGGLPCFLLVPDISNLFLVLFIHR